MNKLTSMIAVFLLLVSVAANAQCKCKEPLDTPEMPPENAASADMVNTEKEIKVYFKSAQEYRECLALCIKEAEKTMSFISGEWNRSVEEYNSKIKNRVVK